MFTRRRFLTGAGGLAAAAIAALELPSQAAPYKDAPLQVFGAHEEATLGQMRNCMGVGNVVAGVAAAALLLDKRGRDSAGLS